MEFNKAALSLADGFPPDNKKGALNRLLKVMTICRSQDLHSAFQVHLHAWLGGGITVRIRIDMAENPSDRSS